jgi:hypothetical protein
VRKLPVQGEIKHGKENSMTQEEKECIKIFEYGNI